jgi:ADP-ribose pyrophosphatase YjhB (NUDIX family)
MTNSIRAKAVCVCRRSDCILVGPGLDSVKGEMFYGPLGGGVEFGERAADAIRREMFEELGVQLGDVTLLGVLENIFTYDGAPGTRSSSSSRLVSPTRHCMVAS